MDDALLERYFPMIEAYFCARVSGPEDVEDLVQEAAYQAVRSWKRFEHRSAVGTWVYAICRNVLCAHRRGVERYGERIVGLAWDPVDPTDEIERRDVGIAIDSLGVRDRQLYDLYYRWGYSVREIAQRLGKPEGTVKYELYVLRRHAKDVLT